MALNKFEDFEHNIEEEDKQAESTDFKSAKKALLEAPLNSKDDIKYGILRGPIHYFDNDDGTISIWAVGANKGDQLEKAVVIKIIGFDTRGGVPSN
jgi:hypothetical protein